MRAVQVPLFSSWLLVEVDVLVVVGCDEGKNSAKQNNRSYFNPVSMTSAASSSTPPQLLIGYVKSALMRHAESPVSGSVAVLGAPWAYLGEYSSWRLERWEGERPSLWQPFGGGGVGLR